MAEQIGIAYIAVDVDTDTMVAGLSKAKAQVTGLSKEAQQQFAGADAATKRMAVSLGKYA